MIEIFDYPQGSPEWFAAHIGVPTAANFADVMASGIGGAPSKTRDLYMRKLAGEIVSGVPREDYSNAAMSRGMEMEAEIRSLFTMMTDQEVEQVGFIRNGRIGASPDGLIGASGMLEVKSEAPHLLIERMLNGTGTQDHMAQLQGQLLVAEREWVWLAIGYKNMKLYTRRVTRNESYIARLRVGLDMFCEDLDRLVDRIRRWRS